jgi:signal transduction histidine kinase
MAFAQRAAVLLTVVCMVLATGSASAQRTPERVGDFTRTVWSKGDGVPDYISSMAQTPDGWLWLASKSGLYRFDGIRAELIDVTTTDGSSLRVIFATSSGDLWLGYASGITLMLPKGDFLHPRRIAGSVDVPRSFLQDISGTMWMASDTALYKNTPTGWHRIGAESGLHGQVVYSVRIDTEGTLWLVNGDGVFSLAAGQARFQYRNDVAGWLNQLVSQYGNEKLVVIKNDLVFFLDIVIASAGKRESPSFSGSRLGATIDADGGFWITNPTYGVIRAANPSRDVLNKLVQDLKSKGIPDPRQWTTLSGGYAAQVLEDRQRNIWVSFVSGLEKFKSNIATTVVLPTGDFNYAMIPGDNGTIWFGNAVSGPAFQWWHADSVAVPTPGYELDTTATFRDIDGSILIGTGSGYLKRFIDGRFESAEPLPPHAANGDDVTAIARDGQKRLWVSIRSHAIYQFSNGRWIANGGFSLLPEKGLLRAVTDARGRLWLSYPHDLFVIDGDHLTRYGRADGMDITNVYDIVPDGVPLIGGDNGFAAFDGHRFHRITTLNSSVLTGINGIVRRKDGTIWLNGYEGAVRISSEEFARGFKDSSYQVSLRVFGIEDGMPGNAQPNRPLPTLIEGTDGRLWFADLGGIAWLDPSKIPQSHFESSVIIRTLRTGNKTYRPDAVPSLAPGTRNIEIDYTAIGLSSPARARFRYQLSGVDSDWQDVESRRQAFYTNLGPGTYVFRVATANEENAWNNATADFSFTIKPTFFQTKWFLALCILWVAALLWIAYLYRLRQVTRRLHQRLDERHAERERIARELHDTYLQAVQSLVFKVHGASRELPESQAKDKIVGALDLADEALLEGRNRVAALRATATDTVDLVAAFTNVAREYHGDKRPSFEVTSTGTPKSVDPLVIDELYASGREAILNALAHACADEVIVNVEYSREGLRVEIVDNGKGIDPQVVLDGGVRGHWGLRGIRERMERVSGQCRLFSDSHSGTTVILFVPASHAYRQRLHIRQGPQQSGSLRKRSALQ